MPASLWHQLIQCWHDGGVERRGTVAGSDLDDACNFNNVVWFKKQEMSTVTSNCPVCSNGKQCWIARWYHSLKVSRNFLVANKNSGPLNFIFTGIDIHCWYGCSFSWQSFRQYHYLIIYMMLYKLLNWTPMERGREKGSEGGMKRGEKGREDLRTEIESKKWEDYRLHSLWAI